MGLIKLEKILSFSSEDNNLRSENIITKSGKWTGLKNGDTKQYLKIKLNEPSMIKQIDIENESSAFIEILVGNLHDMDEDFEALLPATSFMSPSESKNSLNTNRLKIFTYETDLDDKLALKKWEVIKVVCTQPFNTSLQFGISFVKLYDDITNDTSREAAKINTGIFSLKKEVSSSEKTNDESKIEKEDKIESNFEKWKKDKIEINSEQNSSKNLENGEAKSSKENTKEIKKPNSNQILKRVVFAISGFQNPLRSEIRDTGIKLGAKYRPDWTDDCTHLICAFSNTPKAALVRKKGGTIINKNWIFDCKKEKKQLDCDDYKLEEESSDDDSKPRKAARNAKKKIGTLNKKTEFDDSYDEEEAENSDDRDFIADSSEEEEIVSSSSSEQSFKSDASEYKNKKKSKPKKMKCKKNNSDSETDLEEYRKKKEKEMAQEKKRKKYSNDKKKGVKYEDSDDEKKNTKKIKKNNSDSSKTESNSDMDNEKSWELPNFLDEKKFFIHNEFEAKKRKQISKIIYAYGGEVSDYMTKDVSFVIADIKWNKDFDDAKEDNPELKFVESDWLELCHKRKKLIPSNVFEIVKE